MKGTIEYQTGKEEEVKQLLKEYGLGYTRNLKFLNRIVFNYKENEELNAVAMAMKTGKLSSLTLEERVYTIKEVED